MTLRLEKIAPRDDIVYGRTKPPPSPSAATQLGVALLKFTKPKSRRIIAERKCAFVRGSNIPMFSAVTEMRRNF